ncbi:hypothetical protein, partial [Rhizobium laguerreae]|uniref:hypothetical protein n=1 Tax=Rhizobium laguerreae TaxID=1076926 RepID=UPI001C8FA933
STRDVMRCCAAEMAPHRNPPLPNQQQQPKTAGANSKLDKTWGQGQFRCLALALKIRAKPAN